jgi:thiamine biosynthesis protein ThiI
MKEVMLAKYGELALKGKNKSQFEGLLLKSIKKRLLKFGDFDIKKAQSTIYVIPACEGFDIDAATTALTKVFGISSVNRAAVVEKDMSAISKASAEYLRDELASASTFKVEAKRSDKSFYLDSMQIAAEIGSEISSKFKNLKVDVKEPDVRVVIEIRDYGAYVHSGNIGGAGGMPQGSGGRALVLLSGGIDSPVALHMAAKRGLDVVAVHFMSPPYTSPMAQEKIRKISEKLCGWVGRLPVLFVNFTEIQERIAKYCPDNLSTVLMRRSMMRVAEKISVKEKCNAIITGESLGQVASQTLEALICIDDATSLPVLRPLICLDKAETIQRARHIGTFEPSILPYEDCCTVFTPKNPKTKPHLKEVIAAEEKGNYLEIESEVADNYQVEVFRY